jgi:hypothetical protein
VIEPAPEEISHHSTDAGDVLFEATFWGPLRDSLDLTPERWKYLTRIVSLHLVLDRLLTLLITTRLCSGGGTPGGIVETMENGVAELSFARRIELAAKAEWVSAEVAGDLREVNRVRNRLLHFNPKRHRFDDLPEIAPDTAFWEFTRYGFHAWMGLNTLLMPQFEKAAEDEPSPQQPEEKK